MSKQTGIISGSKRCELWFTLAELALDHEALRLAFITYACPRLNPRRLDAPTQAHLNVINALV